MARKSMGGHGTSGKGARKGGTGKTSSGKGKGTPRSKQIDQSPIPPKPFKTYK